LSDFRVATGADLTLFPHLHLAPDGRGFMSGTSSASFFFDTAHKGTWTESSVRQAGVSEYAPSVMYEVGKIIYIGGGSPPAEIVEVIDLLSAGGGEFNPGPGWIANDPAATHTDAQRGTVGLRAIDSSPATSVRKNGGHGDRPAPENSIRVSLKSALPRVRSLEPGSRNAEIRSTASPPSALVCPTMSIRRRH
jgi:hypothetical protein